MVIPPWQGGRCIETGPLQPGGVKPVRLQSMQTRAPDSKMTTRTAILQAALWRLPAVSRGGQARAMPR